MLELEELPSAERYARAVTAIQTRMTANQRTMLEAHFRASGHTATMRELAASIGSDKFQAANAQYGRLGTLLRAELSYQGPGQQSYVIAYMLPPGSEHNDEWLLRMHTPLVNALSILGW